MFQLENAAARIVANKEGVANEQTKIWKDEIKSLTMKVASMENKLSIKKQELDGITGKKRQAAEDENPEKIVLDQILHNISDAASKFDALKHPRVKEISNILNDVQEDNADGEFLMLTQGNSDVVINCPYSLKSFVEAMKK
jgi:hypothetical protein